MVRTIQKKKDFRRMQRVFLREWRKFRNLTQEAAGERIGISHTGVSRIERGLQPFNEKVLQRMADAYRCEVADLLIRNPLDPEGIWSIWDRVPPERRKEAVALLAIIAERAA